MGYAGLTTVMHDVRQHGRALDFMIEAGMKWGAHCNVICAAVENDDPGLYHTGFSTGAQAIAIHHNQALARDVADMLAAAARTKLQAHPVSWNVERAPILRGELSACLSDHMRYSDLALLPLPYGENAGKIDVCSFEACLYGAGIPVLVVPDTALSTPTPSRILIAWDNSAEALAAVRAALPLIKQAAIVEIHIIDPPVYGRDRSDPGGRLAEMLARVGARVEISVTSLQSADIATQLRERACDIGAEMIVMGAYSHSRLREAVIGGVTRSMLRDTTLPVLMAR